MVYISSKILQITVRNKLQLKIKDKSKAEQIPLQETKATYSFILITLAFLILRHKCSRIPFESLVSIQEVGMVG